MLPPVKETSKGQATKALQLDAYDLFFKRVTKNKKHALEFLRLALPSDLYNDFDWSNLRSEASTYVDKNYRERRTDLILSANFKSSGNPVKVILLVEHKAQKTPREVLFQLLDYQNQIYQGNRKAPVSVVPIIVYHGPVKNYSGPVEFQEILPGLEGEVRERLGSHVLNFKCFLLNVHDLDIEKDDDLTLGPIVYIMQNTFNLDRQVIKKLFYQGENLSEEDRREQFAEAARYIQQIEPKFDWKFFNEISNEVIKEAEETGGKKVIRFDQTIDEYLEEGRLEERKEMAIKLLKANMERGLIIQVTGFSEEELKELENQKT